MEERIWLEYPDTGGKQAFSPEAAVLWQARGWVPCAAPAEINPATEERERIAAVWATTPKTSRRSGRDTTNAQE